MTGHETESQGNAPKLPSDSDSFTPCVSLPPGVPHLLDFGMRLEHVGLSGDI